jgi:uncharacterized protein YbjT (DUF2867 family)
LITGATGEIGSLVVDSLIALGERPRVFVRDAEKALIRFGDLVDVLTGDLASLASLKAAFAGIEVVFLVNVGPDLATRDGLAAKVAKAVGVERLIKLSTMDALQGLATGAWHARGEAAIRATGIAFTFIEPSGFMSNALGWAPSIKAESIVRSSTGEGRIAFINPRDIAEVAARVMMTREFDGKYLPITGPEALSYGKMTEKISNAIRKPLKFQPISDDEARQGMIARGASAEETEAHILLWQAIREGRVVSVTDNVAHILGRNPNTFDQWAEENATSFT